MAWEIKSGDCQGSSDSSGGGPPPAAQPEWIDVPLTDLSVFLDPEDLVSTAGVIDGSEVLADTIPHTSINLSAANTTRNRILPQGALLTFPLLDSGGNAVTQQQLRDGEYTVHWRVQGAQGSDAGDFFSGVDKEPMIGFGISFSNDVSNSVDIAQIIGVDASGAFRFASILSAGIPAFTSLSGSHSEAYGFWSPQRASYGINHTSYYTDSSATVYTDSKTRDRPDIMTTSDMTPYIFIGNNGITSTGATVRFNFSYYLEQNI